jgi:hypothetical protein
MAPGSIMVVSQKVFFLEVTLPFPIRRLPAFD